jgi:hypothetical protein
MTDPIATAAQEAMVEVARFESPSEAQLAKGMLESAGIETTLAGQHSNQLIPAACDAVLEVAAADEAAARELLAQAAQDHSESGPEDSPGPELN